jgi:hypothetical protein
MQSPYARSCKARQIGYTRQGRESRLVKEGRNDTLGRARQGRYARLIKARYGR